MGGDGADALPLSRSLMIPTPSGAPCSAPDLDPDVPFMALALAQARLAADEGEVPVGAVVVCKGEVLSLGRNRREADQDPTAHAEHIAIRQAAAQLGSWRLTDCVVYVTLEPCAMCAGAMVLARVARCVYGCGDPKGGFLGSLGDLSSHPRLNHRFGVRAGLMADDCASVLQSFFRQRRKRRTSGFEP